MALPVLLSGVPLLPADVPAVSDNPCNCCKSVPPPAFETCTECLAGIAALGLTLSDFIDELNCAQGECALPVQYLWSGLNGGYTLPRVPGAPANEPNYVLQLGTLGNCNDRGQFLFTRGSFPGPPFPADRDHVSYYLYRIEAGWFDESVGLPLKNLQCNDRPGGPYIDMAVRVLIQFFKTDDDCGNNPVCELIAGQPPSFGFTWDDGVATGTPPNWSQACNSLVAYPSYPYGTNAALCPGNDMRPNATVQLLF